MATIEQRVDGRSLRHPFRRPVWKPVEIPRGETPELDLGGGRSVTLNNLDGTNLLKFETPSGKEDIIVTGKEINNPRALWAGKIRQRG